MKMTDTSATTDGLVANRADTGRPGRRSIMPSAAGPGRLRLTAAFLTGVTPIAPSRDQTGRTDAQAIQDALDSAGSTPVVLGVGVFYLDGPLTMNSGNSLIGMGGACQGGGGSKPSSGSAPGTYLTFGSAWPSTLGGSMISLEGSSCMTLSDLWVCGANTISSYSYPAGQSAPLGQPDVLGPAGVNGVGAAGAQSSVTIVNVGASYLPGAGFAATGTADGWYIQGGLCQNCTSSGIYGYFTDTTIVGMHAQGCGNLNSSGDVDGTPGYLLQGANTRLIGCRSDLSRGPGYEIDASNPAGALGGITLSGCCTQSNCQCGLRVVNPSSTGKAPPLSTPVTVVGCMFDSDGQGTPGNSTYPADEAGFEATGQVMLTVTGSYVLASEVDVTSNGGTPNYGLIMGEAGSENPSPSLVAFDSCFFNCANGSTFVDNTSATTPQFVNCYGVRGGKWDGSSAPIPVT
jgi:hypothetical protein